MFENPSTKKSDNRKVSALLGAAMIAGVGISDAHAEQDNTTEKDREAMYNALSPETIEFARKTRESNARGLPGRRIVIEGEDGTILYEEKSGSALEHPDPSRQKTP